MVEPSAHNALEVGSIPTWPICKILVRFRPDTLNKLAAIIWRLILIKGYI